MGSKKHIRLSVPSISEQIKQKTLESTGDTRHVRMRISESGSSGSKSTGSLGRSSGGVSFTAEHLTMFVGANKATFIRGDNVLFLKSRLRIEPVAISKETGIEMCRMSLNSVEMAFFDSLSPEEFVNFIKKFEVTTRNLKLENLVFETFLLENEAVTEEGMQHSRELIAKMHQSNPLLPPECTDTNAAQLQSAKFYSYSDGGPRISISMRTDLLLRVEESITKKLKSFEKQGRRKKRKMKVELEEAMVRLEEVAETIKYFLNTVTVKNDDNTAIQRIPAEKFIWFMMEWLSNARIIGEKLRMRNCSLKNQFRKLKEVHDQKMFIGENVCETDVDQLVIEGEQYKKHLEEKNQHLIDLKNKTGKAHVDCVYYKNYLTDLLTVVKTFKALYEETAKSIEKYNCEYEEWKRKLSKDARAYKKICDIVNRFKVPEVQDYIKLKAFLLNLKKQLKVLERKFNIMDIMMKTHKSLMSQLTKSPPNRTWFKRAGLDTSIDFEVQANEGRETERQKIGFEFDIYECLRRK